MRGQIGSSTELTGSWAYITVIWVYILHYTKAFTLEWRVNKQILGAVDVCWLSHCKVLKHIRESENELHAFLLLEHNKAKQQKAGISKFLTFPMMRQGCTLPFSAHIHGKSSVRKAFLTSEKLLFRKISPAIKTER